MKNFGFGCMRLPMNGEDVDLVEFQKMVDLFMEKGFTYFDTAQVYIKGKSELALKECLTSKYPRESYQLTDKLSGSCFNKEEDMMPFFNSQLAACGVEYFDYYLMHAQSKGNYQKYQDCHAYEFAQELKKMGKVKHVGLSFHDTPEFLDKILTEHPEIEVVQLQFNYLDYYNPQVESKACYDVCIKHGKKILVMEPIKGGHLINIPKKAQEVFDSLNNGSNASYALRFVASHKDVIMVLSGMSNLEQMMDNVSFMEDFKPLEDYELEAINKVRDIIINEDLIPCTGCRYCVDGCPKKILIPDHFANYNNHKQYGNWHNYSKFNELSQEPNGSPLDCIKCGKCERICPQHLEIRNLLEMVSSKLNRN